MLSDVDVRSLRLQESLSAWARWPIYLFLFVSLRFYHRYRFDGIEEFRRSLWQKLDKHHGPIIWAANHLTLIDSFLIFWALVPPGRISRTKIIPWSTPEYRNYYHLGGPIYKRFIRFLMYACRCIPFLRGGDDEVSVQWRENVYQKCRWILLNGGSVFIFPEAGRSKNGWFDPHRPKDLLGRLAQEVPGVKFLCVYLRGEGQILRSIYPRQGERFRMVGDLIDGIVPGETSPRMTSQRLFNRLAELQNDWFAGSGLAKNCAGNDVIDLASPHARDIFPPDGDPETIEEVFSRRLTAKETAYLSEFSGEERYRTFWKFIAAKEAAMKALAQSGVMCNFKDLEADLFRRRIVHLPTACEMDIALTVDDPEKVHAICVLRGGYVGDDQHPGDVLWEVQQVPDGISPSEFARERCLAFIAASSDDIRTPDVLAMTDDGGIPKVLRNGRVCDWGVSLSHSGRFAAYSFMVS